MFDSSKFKDFTEGLKNIFLLIIYGMLALFCIKYIFPKVLPALTDPNAKWTMGTIKTPFGDFIKSPTDSLNKLVSDKGVADVGVAPSLAELASKVDTINNETDSYWIYLGQIINNKWLGKTFTTIGIDKISRVKSMQVSPPKTNDNILIKTAIYKRKNLPVYSSDGEWKLGKIIGVIDSGNTVSVIREKIIEGQNCWALVH